MKCSSSCIHRFNRPVQVSILLGFWHLKMLFCVYVYLRSNAELGLSSVTKFCPLNMAHILFLKELFFLKYFHYILMLMLVFLGFNSVLWWTDVKKPARGYLKLKSNLKFTYLKRDCVKSIQVWIPQCRSLKYHWILMRN